MTPCGGSGCSDLDISSLNMMMWEREFPAAAASALDSVATYASTRLGAALKSSSLPVLGVGAGGLGMVTRPGASSSQGLAHLTDNEAASSIAQSGILRGPIYASDLTTSSLTGVPYTMRTGVAQPTAGVRIPASALDAFSRPTPIGVFTAWQTWGGTSYTAAGFLDLETGTFIRTGVNWNQVGIYSVDAISTSAVAGGLGFGIYFGSR